MGIEAKSYRFDDEVRTKLAELRSVYGTDNAAMRAVFGLSGRVETLAQVVMEKRVEQKVDTAPENVSTSLERSEASALVDISSSSERRLPVEGWRRGPRQKGDKGR